eukprot:CAMPEP_0116898886 /NCGR_PEP_ID=MMETSP0467-20121206/7544_1 /TAXON_ID=283647 /ORGANISM="Mesodinium pulex, Strain SPMC105" /LENGTH=112 /DNA_ID=CAMNT_0004571333 /DNA_START=1721 /DNA_END=2059 /DNA_ORIENTATION=+
MVEIVCSNVVVSHNDIETAVVAAVDNLVVEQSFNNISLEVRSHPLDDVFVSGVVLSSDVPSVVLLLLALAPPLVDDLGSRVQLSLRDWELGGHGRVELVHVADRIVTEPYTS